MEVYEMRGFLDGFGGVALRAPQDLQFHGPPAYVLDQTVIHPFII